MFCHHYHTKQHNARNFYTDHPLLIRKFLDSESTIPFLDDQPFYHTLIPLFAFTIFSTKVIKVIIAHVAPSIIHKTQKLIIQLSGLKLVKLVNLIDSVDRNNVYST